MIDLGTANPKPDRTIGEFRADQAIPPAESKRGGDKAALAVAISDLDLRISDLTASPGAGAVLGFLAQDVRFLRADWQPFVGASQVQALLEAEAGKWAWQLQKSEYYARGLAYTRRMVRIQAQRNPEIASRNGFYVRIC